MLRAIRLADHHPEPASRAHAAANDTSKFSRNDTRRWWTGYVGNEQAGHNLAVLQTLVMSCHQHGVDPVEYLSDVLIRVQTHPAKRTEELLPHRWQPPEP